MQDSARAESGARADWQACTTHAFLLDHRIRTSCTVFRAIVVFAMTTIARPFTSTGSRYIGDKHLATQHTNKPSHVLCSGQRSAALQLSRSTHKSHRSRRRSRRASLSNLWPPCQVYSDQRVEQRPCGKEVSTWLPS